MKETTMETRLNGATEIHLPSATEERTLRHLPDPAALFAGLTEGVTRPHTILLESAEPSSGRTQRSILLTSAALRIESRGACVALSALDENGLALLPIMKERFAAFSPRGDARRLEMTVLLPARLRSGTEEERLHAPSSLCVLRGVLTLAAHSLADERNAFLAVSFSYDLVEQFETLPRASGDNNACDPSSSANYPDYLFYLADELIEVDHIAGRTRIVVHAFSADEKPRLRARLDALQKDVLASLPVSSVSASPPASGGIAPFGPPAAVDEDDATYAAHVVRIKEHIEAGDVFQIVLSRSFQVPCSDPFAAYTALRALNPSPYLFYMNGGEHVLFGASPESSVKVTPGDGGARTVEISPIAGTRPRGLRPDGSVDPDLDGRMEAELRLDEKENAEHMMLIDLARNDVARVSKPGTRYVADFLRTERYSHVMHLASRVCGELKEDLDALDAYRAAMNMGTLTGSPKIRAMQLLREHEPARRGPYGGAIGYLRGDGSMDTAIVIRSAIVREGTATVHAGAGIVHDSVPATEADETRRKAAAVLRAIEIAKANAREVA